MVAELKKVFCFVPLSVYVFQIFISCVGCLEERVPTHDLDGEHVHKQCLVDGHDLP